MNNCGLITLLQLSLLSASRGSQLEDEHVIQNTARSQDMTSTKVFPCHMRQLGLAKERLARLIHVSFGFFSPSNSGCIK